MLLQIDSDSGQACKIEVLYICGRRLEYHLKLRVLVKSIGIFTVTAVGRTPARLRVYDAIWLRAQNPQKGFRMHRARSNFDVVGLLQNAIARSPVMFKL